MEKTDIKTSGQVTNIRKMEGKGQVPFIDIRTLKGKLLTSYKAKNFIISFSSTPCELILKQVIILSTTGRVVGMFP